MSFKFNFSGEEQIATDSPKDCQSAEVTEWFECVEVKPDIKQALENLPDRAQMFTCGDVEIGHLIAKEAVLKIGDNNLKNVIENAEEKHSDLLSGKYEGGLKIWECTSDLINYLVANPENIDFKISKVLDLGCGVGILGIYAFLNGSEVTFQDYNKEVLESMTIPTILLNIEEENYDDIKNCKFYAGDWKSFNEKLDDNVLFDVILTSETIYNPSNYDKLIQLLLQRLTKDGVAYVAAKTYYFGVGGSMRQFEQKVQNSGMLKAEVCWKCSEGIQREILKVTRNNVFVID